MSRVGLARGAPAWGREKRKGEKIVLSRFGAREGLPLSRRNSPGYTARRKWNPTVVSR